MPDEKKPNNRVPEELLKWINCIAGHDASSKECREIAWGTEGQVNFLQILMDTIPNPIFYKDVHGFFLGCNKAFERITGARRGEIVGKTSYDIFPRELAEKYHELDLASHDHPGEQVFETTLLYANGKLSHVIIYKGTFLDSERKPAGLIGVIVDITERKLAEEALREAHDNLERKVSERTAELVRANEDLKREIEERKRVEEALQKSSEKLKLFAYSVIHDLKSPTIGIYGLTKRLCESHGTSLDATGKRYCEQILKASESVAAMVDNVNVYISAKETPLNIEPLDLKEVLQMVRDEFSIQLADRKVEWIEQPEMPWLQADRLSIVRVFRNLVGNALKYGGEALSRIEIGCRESEGFHVLFVRDNGVGVKTEDTEQLFGLFRREKSARGIEGAGLGLAIVREIAEHHGGKVWLEPGEARGTTFYVSISKGL